MRLLRVGPAGRERPCVLREDGRVVNASPHVVDYGAAFFAGDGRERLRAAVASDQLTVVDVGAGRGTPRLYEAFPEAFHVLVEPLEEHEPKLRDILKQYKGEYFLTAVGSTNRKATIIVDPKSVHKSSLQERTALTSTGHPTENREVPVTTLDTLMEERNFRPPFGLKIDTEGFELEVIRGAPKFLRKTQFVIAEVSVAKRFVGGYSFPEFTEAMTRNGFFLWDIVNVGRGRIVDAVFLPSFNYQPTSLLLRSARSRAKNIMRAIGQRWT